MLQKLKITTYVFILCLFGLTLITVSPVFAGENHRELNQYRPDASYDGTAIPQRNGLILLSKSGHQESEEYNHFWRCSVWERNVISIQKSIKLKRSA